MPPRCTTRSPGPGRPTRRWASATRVATTTSSPPRCCRSRTSSTARSAPKRVIYPGERPLHALRERGVEYIEVRLMDLNPFEPIGIGASTLRFLDVFLLHCLLTDSPPPCTRR
eukprot:Opistho-1_new@12471